ncbi:GNAT family N-acetyltransferase [Streptomyces sp. NPDC003943]
MEISTLWRRAVRRTPLVPVRCADGHHVLRTARLVLRTPRDLLDAAIGEAVAADPEAQRWLGWTADTVIDSRVAEHLLGIDDSNRAERLRSFRAPVRRRLARRLVPGDHVQRHALLAVDAVTGRAVGMGSVMLDEGTIGLQIAPAYRRQGLGVELAEATARFAHDHLGLEVVRAGTEKSNDRCRRALSAAGFLPCDGPTRHTLPDGRVIDSVWYRHGPSETSR